MTRSSLLWRLPLPWVLAWRYMRGERSQMLRSTAAAALLATALGVTAMVVAMALMTGYTEDLKRKLIGLQGEVIASPLGLLEPDGDQPDDSGRLAAAAELPGVARAGRVLFGEGSLSSPALPEGTAVVLRGVDSDDPVALRSGGSLEIDVEGVAGVVLGEELARRLGVSPGDALRLVALDVSGSRPRFRYRSIRITGTFSVGFAEFDSRWILISYGVLAALRGRSDGSTNAAMVEFKLDADADADRTAQAIEDTLGPGWRVNRWQLLNRELFAALAVQELMLFFALGLIVLVSTFNVASTLVILVRERRRDIGVLGALGLSPRRLRACFTLYGLFLGGLGCAMGVTAGSAIAWVITEFELIRFDPEIAAIYFIDAVPFRVEAVDLAAVVAFSLAVTWLACSLPARRATRILPSDALRDE